MADFIQTAKDQLKDMILGAMGSAVAAGELANEPIPAFTVQIPADKVHGDFATLSLIHI